MLSLNEFYKTITEWLLPLGYVEIFCTTQKEYHFIKDGIRVICVNDTMQPYCYLHKDLIHLKFTCSVITGRYKLNTSELDELHNFINSTFSK